VLGAAVHSQPLGMAMGAWSQPLHIRSLHCAARCGLSAPPWNQIGPHFTDPSHGQHNQTITICLNRS
jgi:hypothetical protein